MRVFNTAVLASALFLSTLAQAQTVEVIAELQERPGNPAITPDGRILFSQQPLDTHEFKVVELRKDGAVVPFPNAEWARDRFTGVIGIKAAADGRVWILDMGGEGREPRLVAWDTKANKLSREITIPEAVRRPNSFLQDFVIDERRGVITIADMTAGNLSGESHPALVAIDLKTGQARRLLEDHPSFRAEDRSVTIAGRALATKRPNGQVDEIRFGLNPIAIDPAGEWIYYGTVNGRTVWRLPAAAVADTHLDQATVARRIERYAEKRPSDGIAVDGSGRVFVTDVENSAIGIATPEGYSTLVRDERLLAWPDGFAFGPSGSLYVTSNQLHRHPAVNRGEAEGRAPYYLLRLHPGSRTEKQGLRRSGQIFHLGAEADRLPGGGSSAIVDRRLIDNIDAGVRMFRVDRPVPRHLHRKSDEYLYVVSGRAVLVTGDDPERVLRPGDLIHYGRGTWHEVPRILQAPFVVLAFETPARDATDVVLARPTISDSVR